MIRINERKTKPWMIDGKQHKLSPTAILVYADSPPVDDSDEVNLESLEVSLGPLTPDPVIKRDRYGNADGFEEKTQDQRYYTGNIVTLNDKEFNNFYGVFNSMSIQSIEERKSVISKLHQNFSGDWNVFFFGNSPVVYDFSGVLLDYKDFPYYQEFSMAFDRYLSGRAATINKFKIKIIYNGKIISGFLLSFYTTSNSVTEEVKNFGIKVLVYKEDWVRTNRHVLNPNRHIEGMNLIMNAGQFISQPVENLDVNDNNRNNYDPNNPGRGK